MKSDQDRLILEAQHRQAALNTRRHFFKKCAMGLGAMALGSLMGCDRSADVSNPSNPMMAGGDPATDAWKLLAPKAKRIIYLHMAGAPSQLELFDYKPDLQKLHGLECPPSLLAGKRFAFIQGVPKMLGPQANFAQYGESRAWVSDLLPHFTKVVDDVAFMKAVHCDEFNHAPAQLLMQTGSPRLGRPSMGSWLTYGLGSENENLPGFMVLLSGGKAPSAGKSAWGSGFLPTVYQGVQCRSEGDPVLFLSDPKGMNRDIKQKIIGTINNINKEEYAEMNDPETLTRIKQYEMAFKMQVSVPEAMDINREPDYIHELYGTEPGKASFANNCLLARRLTERGVRFIQLYDWGWDMHGTSADGSIDIGLKMKCQQTDQAISALLMDLKQRGLLDETLVVWGGEFGRTPMQENRGGKVMPFLGRDHHGAGFTMWMAGGGVKPGSYGETDEIGYSAIKDKMHVHDVQATILHLMGINHERFTYPFQGRDFRLTDVHGQVAGGMLA